MVLNPISVSGEHTHTTEMMMRLHTHTHTHTYMRYQRVSTFQDQIKIASHEGIRQENRTAKHYSSEKLLEGIEISSRKECYEGYECFSSWDPVDAALQWVITILWKVVFIQRSSTGGTLILYQSVITLTEKDQHCAALC